MMKFGKFKNLQHVSTHLPQINIPRAKKTVNKYISTVSIR